jgi:hypothetical protein
VAIRLVLHHKTGMQSVSGNISFCNPLRKILMPNFRIVMLLAALWGDTALNDPVAKTARRMVDDIAEIGRSMELLHEFQYLNYADPSQNPIESYGEVNTERLREASRKYDPKGMFQRQVPGGFKLGLHY